MGGFMGSFGPLFRAAAFQSYGTLRLRHFPERRRNRRTHIRLPLHHGALLSSRVSHRAFPFSILVPRPAGNCFAQALRTEGRLSSLAVERNPTALSQRVMHEADEQDLPKMPQPHGAGHRNGPGRLSARPCGLVLPALRRRRQRSHP